MDDFRIGSTPPCDAYRNEQRPADSNRRKAKRPETGVAEDEVHVSQSTESDSETEDDLGVQDYYTPTDRKGEPD
jgi:hypothetical protein